MISVNMFDVVSGGNHRRRQLLIKSRTSFYSLLENIVRDIPIGKYDWIIKSEKGGHCIVCSFFGILKLFISFHVPFYTKPEKETGSKISSLVTFDSEDLRFLAYSFHKF
jgi:hypothetical protein